MPNWTKEQMAAITLDGSNIIVSAGAGSGKTAVLSERVLRKVKDGVDIDKLLVLTFTNAAAAEMKERIRKKLRENDFKNQLTKLDSAYITTFDAYSLSLVKKYHYLLNINKNISICEKSIIDIKKQEIVDSVFEKLYTNDQFKVLIDDFCVKDDLDIRKEVLTINNKLDMIYDKEKYLDEYIDTKFSEKFINGKIEEYVDLIKNKITLINKYYIELEEYVENDYYEKITNELNELLLAKSYKDIICPLKLSNLPRNSEEKAKQIKTNITSLLKEIKELTIYNDEKEIREEILKTKKYVVIIIDIIKEIDKKINLYKKTNDLYEFVDIAKMAIRIVEQNKFVRDELEYNEILIDEYQDTNDLQDLFVSYIENNNVYMVGDIKQSIYRFRNANPNLFKSKYKNYSSNNGGIKIDLNKNFRSREEVLNNINLIFNQIMDDTIGGADYKKEHQMIYGNMDYSNIGKKEENSNMEVLSYDKLDNYKINELEIFIIANDIKNKMNDYKVFDKKLRKIKYSDIAILMDRSTDFSLYKKIFEYLGIPLTVYKKEKINDSDELKLIKNIITFLITADENLKNYAFMSILRSYLFEEKDEKIFECLVNKDYSLLKDYLIDYKLKTPYELTSYIIDKFEFYQKMIKVGDIQNRMSVLDHLLKLSLDLTNMGYDIYDYLDYLEKVINEGIEIEYSVPTKDSDSVKIMTIHASKGLEFPVCYYSGLTSKFNVSELKEKISYDKSIGIITPIVENGIKDTIYKELLKNNYYMEEIAEKIRLFYVALTRSKEKMIVVLPNKEIENNELDNSVKLSYRSLGDMLYSIFSTLGTYIRLIDLNNINLSHNYNLIKKTNYRNKISITNQKIVKTTLDIESNFKEEKHFSKENYKVYDIDEYNNIEFGKHIHSVFENIDFLNPDFSNLSDFEKRKVQKFMKNIDFKKVINIYKEYEFIYNKDDISHGIIDLLLEYDDEFKIIDYKLKNIIDDAYIKQLNGYKEYIKEITNKKVSTYLYSIIDDKLVIV